MLIPTTENYTATADEKNLLVSMIYCVGEWCLKIPVLSLLETSESDKGCLNNVFQVSDKEMT